MVTTRFNWWVFLSLPLSILVAHTLLYLGGGSVELGATWIPLRCPLELLTGWLCPTCGLGRSLLSSLTLQLELGRKYHALGPVIVFCWSILWGLNLARIPFPQLPIWIKKGPVLWALIGLYVVIGFSRNFSF